MDSIKNRKEYYTIMAEVEQFLEKGFDKLSAAEEERLTELSKLISAYEAIHFPMPVKHDIATLLEAYRKENGLSRQKLAAFLEVGNSTLSEIMNRKRPITFDFAKKLHNKIHFDGNMILEMS